MRIEYSYQDLIDGAMIENKTRKKNIYVGMLIMLVPAMILGMVVLAYLLRGADDHKYTVEIRPYQELTSPYRPYPIYLGQDLPQIWTVRIVNGKQFGTAEFQEFRLYDVPDSMRVTLAEYKQILIDSGAYREYMWASKQQRNN